MTLKEDERRVEMTFTSERQIFLDIQIMFKMDIGRVSKYRTSLTDIDIELIGKGGKLETDFGLKEENVLNGGQGQVGCEGQTERRVF